MRLSMGFALAFVTLAVATRKCGTEEPSAELIAASNKVMTNFMATSDFKTEARVVPTYFHVLRSGTAVSEGNIPDSSLYKQLDVLNADYTPTGISFKLLGITRTTSSAWYNGQNDADMKTTLRRGDYGTLNVYFHNMQGGDLGFCYYPKANPSSATIRTDGCSIRSTTVPGGSATNYNLGRTLTHETGHWFGLYHTFRGGCTGDDDSISDTPAEASGASGCPIGRDSCPGAGVDPIHNYMDYSYDACLHEFSPGQIARMNSFYSLYR